MGGASTPQAPLHLRQVRTATSVRTLVPMYLLMVVLVPAYLISLPIEGSLPPPIASLGTQTGHQAWGTWTLDYGPLAAADSAVEAFPRPAVKAEDDNMEK